METRRVRTRPEKVVAQDKESTVRRPELPAIAGGNPQYAESAVLCARLGWRRPAAVTVERGWPLGLLAFAALLAALVLTLGVRVNLSGSVPRGTYRMVREDPTRAALVGVCLPLAPTGARLAGISAPADCP